MRTGFHYKEIERLRKPVDFDSTRLDVPCSDEAYLRVNLPDLTVGASVPFAEMIASGMAT